MKATALAMRALSWSIVVSLSSKRGGSSPARRATPFFARSVAICTCRVSANISGASRELSSTEESIFLAAAKAAPLSRTPDSALRLSSIAGIEACDIENDIELSSGTVLSVHNGSAADHAHYRNAPQGSPKNCRDEPRCALHPSFDCYGNMRERAIGSRKPHRVDRRQRVGHAGPAVALVLAHPQPAGGRAEGEPLALPVERQRMAVDHVVGVRLRQAAGENIEALAAVAGAGDHQLAFARDALLVLDLGDEPRGVGLARMHRDRKPEHRRLDPG